MKKLLAAALLGAMSLTSAASFADTRLVDCGAVDFDVFVHGDRDGQSEHAERMLLLMNKDQVSAECSHIRAVYYKNDKAAYDSFLAMAMTAKVSGKKLHIRAMDDGSDSIYQEAGFISMK